MSNIHILVAFCDQMIYQPRQHHPDHLKDYQVNYLYHNCKPDSLSFIISECAICRSIWTTCTAKG